jgi:hypothetical protein
MITTEPDGQGETIKPKSFDLGMYRFQRGHALVVGFRRLKVSQYPDGDVRISIEGTAKEDAEATGPG